MAKLMSVRFTGKVENCIRSHLRYPQKLIDFLYTEGGFSRESVIADIGAGPGLFSRYLLERGSRVVAIDPDDNMIDIAERLLSEEFGRFVCIRAYAENTTLDENSVHHIVCADSFHLFDADRCRKEFMRILKPKGVAALLWNGRVCGEDAFSKEFAGILQRYSGRDQNINKVPTGKELSEFFGNDDYSSIVLPGHQVLDFEGMIGRLLSNSCPNPEEGAYREMVCETESLFNRYNRYGKVTFHFLAEGYIGRFN